MKASGAAIERSTCDSAAKWQTVSISKRSKAVHTAARSQMSACTIAYRCGNAAAMSARLSGLAAYVSLSKLTTRPVKPASSRRNRTKLEPMNPHPPVTRMFCMRGRPSQ